jgi:hypothetical protein
MTVHAMVDHTFQCVMFDKCNVLQRLDNNMDHSLIINRVVVSVLTLILLLCCHSISIRDSLHARSIQSALPVAYTLGNMLREEGCCTLHEVLWIPSTLWEVLLAMQIFSV